MSGPTLVQVPRPGQSRSSLALQSSTNSPAMNAWLSQSETDVPWHNLDSIVIPSTSQNISHSNSTSLPSDNAATQGSVGRHDSDTGTATTHVQGHVTRSINIRQANYADLNRHELVERPHPSPAEVGTSQHPTARAHKHEPSPPQQLRCAAIKHRAVYDGKNNSPRGGRGVVAVKHLRDCLWLESHRTNPRLIIRVPIALA